MRFRYGEQAEYHRQRAKQFGRSAEEATNRNSRKMYRFLTITEEALAERAEHLRVLFHDGNEN
jgi:hypothetical protein